MNSLKPRKPCRLESATAHTLWKRTKRTIGLNKLEAHKKDELPKEIIIMMGGTYQGITPSRSKYSEDQAKSLAG